MLRGIKNGLVFGIEIVVIDTPPYLTRESAPLFTLSTYGIEEAICFVHTFDCFSILFDAHLPVLVKYLFYKAPPPSNAGP